LKPLAQWLHVWLSLCIWSRSSACWRGGWRCCWSEVAIEWVLSSVGPAFNLVESGRKDSAYSNRLRRYSNESQDRIVGYGSPRGAQKVNTAFVSQSRNRSYGKCENGIFCEATSWCCYHHRRWRDWRVVQYHHCLLINTHSLQALVPL
jgi:hypothetical protein